VETDANGIDAGTIVGSYDNGSSQTTHGFLYAQATWTPGLPWAATTLAYGVSGSTVVGWYRLGTQDAHGFILVVPEPAGILLLASGDGRGDAIQAKAMSRVSLGPAWTARHDSGLCVSTDLCCALDPRDPDRSDQATIS